MTTEKKLDLTSKLVNFVQAFADLGLKVMLNPHTGNPDEFLLPTYNVVFLGDPHNVTINENSEIVFCGKINWKYSKGYELRECLLFINCVWKAKILNGNNGKPVEAEPSLIQPLLDHGLIKVTYKPI